ncbi:hypothetical protein M197_gp07 [Haloarcula hispanica tailed virus 2]|uniref:Uncharacterized protein n=1 Tax=Haloarcula hispanica tailed virus 2 TaxID=1273751 RepID=R4T668_9CAUD|nr:hypothetical protein M197_gp07 [Haloarcula hispanica tailed virus 2]AGM11174.1 hypothetical protein HHTV2_7 [Haloarcula hispanica tailed virus 2]
MTLFINRWSTPVHVFDLPASEAVDLSGADERYEASGESNQPSLCGMDLDAANSQGQMYRDKPHVLRVSRMARWEDLHAFVLEDELCEECRGRIPDVWPPARDLQHPDEDRFLERGEDPDEPSGETLGELFG